MQKKCRLFFDNILILNFSNDKNEVEKNCIELIFHIQIRILNNYNRKFYFFWKYGSVYRKYPRRFPFKKSSGLIFVVPPDKKWQRGLFIVYIFPIPNLPILLHLPPSR